MPPRSRPRREPAAGRPACRRAREFWDPGGAMRTEALLKSYLELERKLGSMVPLPSDDDRPGGAARLRRALGVPNPGEQYQIEARDALVEPDPRSTPGCMRPGSPSAGAAGLRSRGRSPLPARRCRGELRATRDAERLAALRRRCRLAAQQARQIKDLGARPAWLEVFRTLASSYDGVLAIHPDDAGARAEVLQEARGRRATRRGRTRRMMRDPRYWRERDPRSSLRSPRASSASTQASTRPLRPLDRTPKPGNASAARRGPI